MFYLSVIMMQMEMTEFQLKLQCSVFNAQPDSIHFIPTLSNLAVWDLVL